MGGGDMGGKGCFSKQHFSKAVINSLWTVMTGLVTF